MRRAFVGFDSAWGGKTRGGICSAVFDGAELAEVGCPEPAGFDDAKRVVHRRDRHAEFTLLAIDQPTTVPNATGMRPVERVAGSVKLGVQPANLSSSMFNRYAPIWTFLDDLGGSEEPRRAQQNAAGLHVIEVFPGLALPALLPTPPDNLPLSLHYNPAKKANFSITHWRRVADCAEAHAQELNIGPFVEWAAKQSENPDPTKEDQDCLDALLCLIVALKWWREDPDTVVLGDWRGHIVTPLSAEGLNAIKCAATKKSLSVPIGDGSWALYDAALGYFDGKHYDAFEWLGHPSAALGGETPLERAKTPEGKQDVLDLIGRLEHGIPT